MSKYRRDEIAPYNMEEIEGSRSCHTARHEAANGGSERSLDGPDHRPARPVRLCNHCIIRDVDPFIVDAYAVMAVLGFPIRVRKSETIRIRTARSLARPEAVKPWLQRRQRIAAVVAGLHRTDECRHENAEGGAEDRESSYSCSPPDQDTDSNHAGGACIADRINLLMRSLRRAVPGPPHTPRTPPPESFPAPPGDSAAPSARATCNSAPTTAPSPMAAPTRLTDPDRTSPEANTRRTLVSSGSGRPDPLFDGRTSKGTSEPVKTKFLLSRATPLSLSQAVAGSAPMKQKTWRIGFSVSSPVKLSRQRTRSSCFSRLPQRATISVWVNTSILSIALMRSMRYCDMLSAKLGPRTSIQIFLAKLRRKPPAWPAELPAPTKTISSSRQTRASIGEAQYQTPRPSKSPRFGTPRRR